MQGNLMIWRRDAGEFGDLGGRMQENLVIWGWDARESGDLGGCRGIW